MAQTLTRARRGAKFLDKKLGTGWRKKIKRRKLDMALGTIDRNGCGCIVAQLFPGSGYVEGLDKLGINPWAERDEKLGFDTSASESYDELAEAWLQVLREKAAI
jgi:hypothetical protein